MKKKFRLGKFIHYEYNEQFPFWCKRLTIILLSIHFEWDWKLSIKGKLSSSAPKHMVVRIYHYNRRSKKITNLYTKI
jgi:hypothetical protein